MTEEGDSLRVLVGQSARMRQLQRQIERLAQCRWPVLLLGETGTGKEVVARALHQADPAGPFVTIDCSALVGPLMESELFGHVKGAFTGAHTSKIGMIELADSGTAFLDEIGELPLDLQAKLLRVLQEKEFRPVGAVSARRADFRVIAATNRDLAKEVEKGTFRRDLYYRLNVVALKLQPLRERREDIPALLVHFLGRYGNGHQFTPEAMQALLSYDWPGNVRELENCVQRMVAVNSGPLLHTGDLPTHIQNYLIAQRQQARAAAATVQPMSDTTIAGTNGHHPVPDCPVLPLIEVERRAILKALEYTRGDRALAAQLLGIGRTTLYRKLKEYEMIDEAE
jgi:DNA-binding NtrC family response regulator